MTRYRWYVLQIPGGAARLVSQLGKSVGTNKAEGWFAIEDSERDRVRFKFLWRSLVRVVRLGPSGEAISDLVATINVLDAELTTFAQGVLMRLVEPNRNLRVLFSSLEAVAGFGFVIKPILFDEVMPEVAFKKADEMRMVGVKVTNVTVGRDVVGRMEFASRHGIRLDDIKPLRGVTYKTDWSAYELVYKGLRGYISLASNGVARIGGPLEPKILADCEVAILKSARRL